MRNSHQKVPNGLGGLIYVDMTLSRVWIQTEGLGVVGKSQSRVPEIDTYNVGSEINF